MRNCGSVCRSEQLVYTASFLDDRQLYVFCGFPGCGRPHAGEQTQTGDLDRCGAVDWYCCVLLSHSAIYIATREEVRQRHVRRSFLLNQRTNIDEGRNNYVTCAIMSILAHATQFNPLSQHLSIFVRFVSAVTLTCGILAAVRIISAG